jgi:hypothetical protein
MTNYEKAKAIEDAERQIKDILIALEQEVGKIDRVTVDGDDFMTVSICLS